MESSAQIAAAISRFAMAYYFWIIVYGVLGLGAILGPALAATSFLSEGRSKVAAFLGAGCAAAFGFLTPNVYATSYDVALRIARDLGTDVALKTMSPEDISAQLRAAEALVHFSYSGLQDVAAKKTGAQ